MLLVVDVDKDYEFASLDVLIHMCNSKGHLKDVHTWELLQILLGQRIYNA